MNPKQSSFLKVKALLHESLCGRQTVDVVGHTVESHLLMKPSLR